MKAKIHPEYKKTQVSCSSCNASFESHSTVDKINVEICSNCHPFYTGKQKLVDTAGRVDRFKAQKQAAMNLRKSKSDKQAPEKVPANLASSPKQKTHPKEQ